jgi:hypothetical protein
MKKFIVGKLKDLFRPVDYQEINPQEIFDILADPSVRKAWLFEVLQELVRINRSIDQKLVSGVTFSITDLSARRRGLQFVLDTALAAKREVERAKSHNCDMGVFDLDEVTVRHSPR